MSHRLAFLLCLTAFAGVLGTSLVLTERIIANGAEVAETEHRHFAAYKLADELRQSSDDLTRLARTYVVSGDPFYKECFDATLQIRNGERGRPVDYGGIYWDQYLAERTAPRPDGPSVALERLLRDLGLEEKEFLKLREAQVESDELVRLEAVAMNAMQGRYDDGTGTFSEVRQPDPVLAREILFGERYHKAKARIMRPVGDVLELLEQRRNKELGDLRREGALYQRLCEWALGFGLLLALVTSVLAWRLRAAQAATDFSTQSARRKILAASILTTAVVAVAVSAVTIYFLYSAAFELRAQSLSRIANTQVRLIEAVARFDRVHSQDAVDGGGRAATLAQIVSAHQGFHGLGETGELVFATLEKGSIKFLLDPRHPGPSLIPMEGSPAAEPMRRALQGERGTLVGADYRGESVLAAFQPVGEGMSLALVAKIDVAEIRAPFVTAGVIVMIATVLCILGGAVVSVRFLSPLVEQVEAGEANLKSILGAAAEGILSTDVEGKIEAINPAAEQMFGYLPGGLLGRSVRTLFADLPAGDTIGTIASSDGQFVGLRRSGGTFPMEVSLSEVVRGEIHTGYTAIMRDVTERKAVERELREAKEAADAASRAKSAFLSSMSHELRTPLNGVLGYVQILQQDPELGERQAKNLEGIESCGQHLLSLINDVLDISKIESGSVDLDLRATNLEKLLNEVSDILRPRAEVQGLQWTLELDPLLPRGVRCDAAKLRQVLVNLGGNAIKFCPAGRVLLSAQPAEQGQVRFEVRDTGVGIEPDMLDAIFEPFKQADAGKNKGGTGLGLAICRRLVEAMDGRLNVTSQLGVGTAFTVLLPLEGVSVQEAESLSATWVGTPVVPETDPPQILVVDDVPANRDVLSQLLITAGFRCGIAKDGVEAIGELRKGDYQLVLMDVRMPEMDGDEAVRVIKADPDLKQLPVLAVTAGVFGADRDQVMSAGFDGFLLKPVQTDELFMKLAEHLGLDLTPVAPAASEEAMAQTVYSPPPDATPAPGALDPRLKQRLLELAELGDVAELVSAAGEVGGELGERIVELAEGFEFDGITERIQAL